MANYSKIHLIRKLMSINNFNYNKNFLLMSKSYNFDSSYKYLYFCVRGLTYNLIIDKHESLYILNILNKYVTK